MNDYNKLFLSKSKICKGQGVFVNEYIEKNEKIMDFHGRLFKSKELLKIFDPSQDYYIQIGKNLYVGPSGMEDDFINHSCDANSVLLIKKQKAFLIALKNIKKGQEITLDYSITMLNDNWKIDCSCGSKNCRKIIKEFKYLPKNVQEKYIKLGIVPKYVIDGLKNESRRKRT
ncbi:MAG TPA: SET domain-containing protein-lysine N-methyltransferase [Candidatus Nanoarchaeia archaeon]|nr:SET domain-containing protein-lysine N-methyltransferase [Candidatus Nanoarchaeia archaeon]